jgi:predicted membrane-bound mannosyltransferase
MVYYSRYYIPEMLLTTLTCATIVSGYRYARTGKAWWAIAAGASAGLMFAAKETAAIAIGCMLLALAITVRPKPHKLWHAAAALAIAVLIALSMLGFADSWSAVMGYTQRAFREPAHRDPWNYYLSMLAWKESLILVLAVAGACLAFVRKTTSSGLLRFLSVYACAITLAYSLIPYKTPWCVLGPLDAMILLAGAGAVNLLEWLRGTGRIAVLFVLSVCVAYLGFQAWWTSFPFAADPRNPYAYAHTGRDVYTVRDSIENLARSHPQGNDMLIQVIGAENLWPLPWYLRSYPHVEWWRRLGAGFHPADVILLTPDMEPALIHEIYEVPPPGKRDLYRPLLDRYVELRPQLELRGYVRASLGDRSIP